MTISRRSLLNWILPSALLALFSSRSSAASPADGTLKTLPAAKTPVVGVKPDALRLALEKENGFELVGGFFAGEGKATTGSGTASVFDRAKQRGQFDIVQGVADPKGIAGITFGGPNNRGALIIDERGRLQTYAAKEGRPSAARVAIPFSEPYGQGVAGWNGSILRLPFAGAEDDTLHSSLIFLPKADGSADMYIAGPGQYTNYSAPYADARVVSPRVVTDKDLIPALMKGSVGSSDWISRTSWVKLFTINTGVRSAGPNFTGLYIAGGTLSESIYTYLIQCNDVFVTSLDTSSARHVLRITNLRDPADSRHGTADLTQFGYVYDTANKQFIVYARIAGRNEGATLIPLRYSDAGNSGVEKVIIHGTEEGPVTTEPQGIVYIETAWSLTSNTHVALNDGRVVNTAGAVVRLSDSIYAATRSPVQDSFQQNDNFSAINRGYAKTSKVAVSKTGTGKYTLTGTSTKNKNAAWKISNPVIAGGGGIQNLVASIESDSANTIEIGVRMVHYLYDSAKGTMTPTPGSYTDIPADSWVDIHTTLL
ncbi:hypothetical protein ACCY16_20395 [Candidatus Pantoea formicae]|uniref:hypothetical protein n=1 Tax=Candidatus Pantoea formicae TaxID=2608355 RepID=UPI003ED9D5D1